MILCQNKTDTIVCLNQRNLAVCSEEHDYVPESNEHDYVPELKRHDYVFESMQYGYESSGMMAVHDPSVNVHLIKSIICGIYYTKQMLAFKSIIKKTFVTEHVLIWYVT